MTKEAHNAAYTTIDIEFTEITTFDGNLSIGPDHL
ncbi:hypothetical protein ACVME8_001512 [Bradyrhizobium diazoefficiens]